MVQARARRDTAVKEEEQGMKQREREKWKKDIQ
jgi:hypothetical protein